MTLLRTPRRLSVIATLLMVASLLSCGREITGLEGSGGRTASVAFAPHFPTRSANSVAYNGANANSFSDLVPFNRVRVILRRGDEIVVERIVPFEPSTDSVALGVTVTLSASSGNEGETFSATLEYLNADNAVVFRGGPIDLLVRPGIAGTANPIEIELEHVGPGSGGVFLNLNPDSIAGTMGDTVEFIGEAYDNQESFIEDAVILFVSRDTLVGKIVTPGQGRVRLVGARGATWIVAELFGGDIDSSIVVIEPMPTALAIISGNAQQTVQNTLFANPLRVQVRAADNLGVAGWPVTFAVTGGQGSLDSTAVLTDVDGFAQARWTAGDSVSAATVTASISGPTLTAIFTGTQLTSGPAITTFETQPVSITAGGDLPSIQVAVRNGAAQIITEYTGPVALTLTGGTAGAKLVGDTTLNAVAGIATFPSLTVDRAGTSYRLVANVAGAAATQSNTFNVAAAPPALLAVTAGTGQSATASTALTDSIKFRITDEFNFPVAGVTVGIVGILGGGSVSPASGMTDANGVFATEWTLGASGPQQITAFVSGLATVNATATIGGGAGGALFAGYDFTNIAAGQSRSIPVFLSAPSGSPTTVHLSVSDTTIAWQSDSVQIPAGNTSIGIPLNGLVPGEGWAILTSALGTDSVFVLVGSASLSFPSFDQYAFTVGDTLRTVVMLSDPAPPGGVVITVRSLNPAYVLVAPGTGLGAPVPACLGGYYCYYGGEVNLRAAGSDPLLLAPPADTALLFVPEGQLVAQLVMITVGAGLAQPNTIVTAEAAGYGYAETQVYVDYSYLYIYGADGYSPYEPLGVGQRIEAYVYRSNESSVREISISLVSRDTLVFTVDSSVTLPRDYGSGRFSIRAVAPGAAWLDASAPGSEPDSVLITVTAPELLVSSNSGAVVPVHFTTTVSVVTTGALPNVPRPRLTSLPITWTVTNPAAMSIDAPTGLIDAGTSGTYVTVRMIALGDGYVVATATGHAPDSVFISVSQNQAITLFTGSPSTGEGQYAFVEIGVPNQLRETIAHTVTVTSLHPAIARVLTPTVELTRDRFTVVIQLVGVSAGNATIELSAPGFSTTTFNFAVSPARLTLANLQGSSWVADSVVRAAVGFTGSLFGVNRPPMDTVVATLRSSNPSVIEVTDSVMVFAPGNSYVAGGGWRPLAPGSATLTLHAPGYLDSDSVVVTVKPFALFASFSLTSIGRGLEGALEIFRDSPINATLPITITQSGPGALTFAPGSDSIFAGSPARSLSPVGLTLGMDTLIISSPGFIPDTVIVNVYASELVMIVYDQETVIGQVDPGVSAFLSHSASYLAFGAGVETRLVVRSTDTTRARVLQDTVKFAAGEPYPFQTATVSYVGLGWVALTVEDPDGIFAPDTVEVLVGPRTLYSDNYYYDGAPIALGMRQRTDPYELYVSREYESPDSLVVYLTSSNPTVVMVPDSILIEAGSSYGYFSIAAGDTVGSARVTASSPGWNESEWYVVVTRGTAVTYGSSTYVGGMAGTEIYLEDAITHTTRETTIPIAMQLVSDRPDIANPAGFTFEFPAYQTYHYVTGVLGVSPGSANIQAVDTRTGDFRQMLSESGPTEVYPSSVYLLDERVSIGLGLQSSSYRSRVVASPIRDSVWVHLSSVGGKFALPADSVLLSYENGHYLDLDLAGIISGVDTLLMSADGLGSDTAVIVIEPGVLHLLPGTAPTIVIGDSTLVTLELRDAGGFSASASTMLTINFTIDTTFAVTDGTSTIGTLQIDPASSVVSFWVRAEQDGTSELVITSPNFRTFRYVFTTRPLAGL